MRTSREIVENFSELNVHDNTLVDIKILPSQKPKTGRESVVEICLARSSVQQPRKIRFLGCANLRVAMDFDVLAANLAPNTSGSHAHVDMEKIRDLMESQEADWDVGYGGSSKSPLAKKLTAIEELIFFRVQFFGGVVEVIARDYQVDEWGRRDGK